MLSARAELRNVDIQMINIFYIWELNNNMWNFT